jgi:hypothetical protein
VPDDTAYFLIRNAIERRRALAYGQLHDTRGLHCAMGAFFKDNPDVSVHTDLVDEVAAVNDSVPPTATPKERWLTVRRWLRWKLRVLATKEKK